MTPLVEHERYYQKNLMRGKKYNQRKVRGGQTSNRQNVGLEVAKETNVSTRTIERDAKFAQAVDTLSDFKNEICTGQTQRTKQEIVSIYDFLTSDIPDYYTPDIHVLYNNPTEVGTLTKAFKVIDEALDRLSGQEYRELQKTTETKVEDGRELVLWKAVDKEIDVREFFFKNLESLTVKSANKAERETLLHVKPFKDIFDVWKPVVSDEEYQRSLKAIEREKELENIAKYTPKIINGDVLKEITKISTESIDLIVTDPPYNMNKAEWDSFGSGEEFSEWAEKWLKECFRILKPTGSIYIFGINRMLSHIQMRMEQIGFNYKNWIVWDTIQGAGGGLWVNRQEAILYYSKTDKPYENKEAIKLERAEENIREYKGVTYEFKNPSNIWRFPVVDNKHKDRTSHPTQKPVELIERIIKANSKQDDNVLDCFMGSGTTGVACMKLKRKCIGFELSKDYIDISNDRFADTKVGDCL